MTQLGKKWGGDLDKSPGPAWGEFLLNRPLYILIWQSMHCWPKYRDGSAKTNSEDVG